MLARNAAFNTCFIGAAVAHKIWLIGSLADNRIGAVIFVLSNINYCICQANSRKADVCTNCDERVGS